MKPPVAGSSADLKVEHPRQSPTLAQEEPNHIACRQGVIGHPTATPAASASPLRRRAARARCRDWKSCARQAPHLRIGLNQTGTSRTSRHQNPGRPRASSRRGAEHKMIRKPGDAVNKEVFWPGACERIGTGAADSSGWHVSARPAQSHPLRIGVADVRHRAE